MFTSRSELLAVHAQVLGHSKTVLVLLGGWAFLGDRVSGRQAFGMALAVVGMVAYGMASSQCAPLAGMLSPGPSPCPALALVRDGLGLVEGCAIRIKQRSAGCAVAYEAEVEPAGALATCDLGAVSALGKRTLCTHDAAQAGVRADDKQCWLV